MGEQNTAEELINGVSGAAGEYKASQGPGLPPVWTAAPGAGEAFYSESDTLADIVEQSQTWTAIADHTTVTWFTIASGVKCLGGMFFVTNKGVVKLKITIDGAAVQTLTCTDFRDTNESHSTSYLVIPPFLCLTSLLVEADNVGAATYDWAGYCWTKL